MADQTQPAEVVETTALVITDPREVVMRGKDDAARKADTENLLATVERIIGRDGATMEMGQTNYLLVDTWRAVGAAAGVFACTVDGSGVWFDDPLTLRPAYRVTVEARYSGQIVGVATGTCSSGETYAKTGKLRWSEAHQVEAMAQTRASSRALRNALGWLVDEVEGYSSTAAEEMSAANETAADARRAARPGARRRRTPAEAADAAAEDEMVEAEVRPLPVEEMAVNLAAQGENYVYAEEAAPPAETAPTSPPVVPHPASDAAAAFLADAPDNAKWAYNFHEQAIGNSLLPPLTEADWGTVYPHLLAIAALDKETQAVVVRSLKDLPDQDESEENVDRWLSVIGS